MKNRFKYFCIVLSFAVSNVSQAQSFLPNTADALGRAHASYLSGDLKGMAVNLKQALTENPTDALIKENALTLLKKAYEVSENGQVPADWRLPDEIKQMKVGVKHSLHDEAKYNFRVYGSTVHKKTISQLQVIQYPDHVVLDKQGGVGHWNDNAGIDELSNDYELSTDSSRQLIPGGLYLINLTLADGTQTKGWFLMGDEENSTGNPRVFVPSVEQVFKTGNPTFSWQSFTSPQYQPSERRTLWVGVSRSEPPNYDWDEVWGHYETPPANEQITIDSHGDDQSVSKLENGHYAFFVDYHERKKFGDLDITRDSITVRSFRIAQ